MTLRKEIFVAGLDVLFYGSDIADLDQTKSYEEIKKAVRELDTKTRKYKSMVAQAQREKAMDASKKKDDKKKTLAVKVEAESKPKYGKRKRDEEGEEEKSTKGYKKGPAKGPPYLKNQAQPTGRNYGGRGKKADSAAVDNKTKPCCPNCLGCHQGECEMPKVTCGFCKYVGHDEAVCRKKRDAMLKAQEEVKTFRDQRQGRYSTRKATALTVTANAEDSSDDESVIDRARRAFFVSPSKFDYEDAGRELIGYDTGANTTVLRSLDDDPFSPTNINRVNAPILSGINSSKRSTGVGEIGALGEAVEEPNTPLEVLAGNSITDRLNCPVLLTNGKIHVLSPEFLEHMQENIDHYTEVEGVKQTGTWMLNKRELADLALRRAMLVRAKNNKVVRKPVQRLNPALQAQADEAQRLRDMFHVSEVKLGNALDHGHIPKAKCTSADVLNAEQHYGPDWARRQASMRRPTFTATKTVEPGEVGDQVYADNEKIGGSNHIFTVDRMSTYRMLTETGAKTADKLTSGFESVAADYNRHKKTVSNITTDSENCLLATQDALAEKGINLTGVTPGQHNQFCERYWQDTQDTYRAITA